MDFALVINDNREKLSQPNDYFDHLWDCICKHKEVDSDAYLDEKTVFLNHLPINLQAFFMDCIHKIEQLLSSDERIDWNVLDQKYLCVIVFWAINQIETATSLTSIGASRLYFLLNCLPKEPEQAIFFESIHSAILTSIDFYIPIEDVSLHLHVLLENMKLFLTSNTLHRDLIRQTASVLNKIICMDRQTLLSRFQTDEPTINLQHAAFICLKVILQKYDCSRADEREQIMYILFLITGCLKSTELQNKSRETLSTLFSNITAFLKDMCSNFTQNDALVALVIKTLAVNPSYDMYSEMVGILANCSYKLYMEFCWWAVEGLVCNKKEFRKNLSNVAVAIVKQRTSNTQEQGKKETVIEVLIMNLMKLCGDNSYEIAENACRNLEMVLYTDDACVRSATRRILSKNITIGNVLRQHLDVKWKKKQYNRSFINITCKLCVLHEAALTDTAMNDFELLFTEANPMDLRPCLNNLTELMRRNSTEPCVVNVILKFFVKMTLSPVGAANFYAKVLYDILFQSVEPNIDSTIAFNIADALTSQNYDHNAVFKKFFAHNMLLPWKLKVLINHKVRKNPSALNLICSMLDHLDYNEFGALVEYTDTVFMENDFDYASALFYAIDKILSKSTPGHCSDDKLTFIKNLQLHLESGLQNRMLPVDCSSNGIALMVKLKKYARGVIPIEQIFAGLEMLLSQKLSKIWEHHSLEPFEICRVVAYVGDFLLITKQKLSPGTITLLRNILQPDNVGNAVYLNANPEIWSYLITFHTQLSLTDVTFTNENILILEAALKSTDEQVRHHALRSMEDMCAFRLSYFQPLVPWIFQFVVEEVSFLTLICVRIINRLVVEDYVVLNECQYVALTSILGHTNNWIKMSTEQILQENFLLKCQKVINKHFVPSIIYYNNYIHHDVFFVQNDPIIPQTLTYHQRKNIYTFLFTSAPTNTQFLLLNEIVIHILDKILHGKLINSSDLLMDSVTIIGIMTKQIVDTADETTEKQYEKVLKDIQKHIVGKQLENSLQTKYNEHHYIIKHLMAALLKLTYQIHIVNHTLKADMLRTVLITTKVFLPEIAQIVSDGCEELVKLYRQFKTYYENNKHVLCEEELNESLNDMLLNVDTSTPHSSFMGSDEFRI